MWAAARVREASVRVQVRRADGQVEDLGVVSRYERDSERGMRFAVRRWWRCAAERWRMLLARVNEALSALLARLWVRGVCVGAARTCQETLSRLAWPWRRDGAGKER